MKYKYIINIMENSITDTKLKIILEKYKTDLVDYKIVDDNIELLPVNCYIKYISKKNYVKKGGFLKEVKDKNILKLYIKNNSIYIYTKNYFIFYKERSNNTFKNQLKKLVDTNFSSFTITPQI